MVKRALIAFLVTSMGLSTFLSLPTATATTSCIESGLNLGTAGNFSVLAPTITLAGSTLMNSGMGAQSFAAATGEAEVTDPVVQKHFGDETYTVAMNDLSVAIDCALSWSASAIPFNDPSHLTFTPGVYIQTAVEATTAATSVITLDAASDPNGVFIFLFPSNFTPGASVNMLGGAKPENVYWVMAGNFTLGAASAIWRGNVLAGANITLGGSDILYGRVLAKTAITTSANIIESPPYQVKVVHTASLKFTDSTLNPVTIGVPYSDTITARATVDGVVTSDQITYWHSGTLPTGLSLDQRTGVVSGILSSDAATGTLNYNFYVDAPSFVRLSVPVSFVVYPAPVPVSNTKSIIFTDTTLNPVTIGAEYSDFVQAVALVGSETSTSAVITYAVDTLTPLAAGLSLNSSSGYVTGTVTDTSTVGRRNYIFIASSGDFPEQRLSYSVDILSGSSGGQVEVSRVANLVSNLDTSTINNNGSSANDTETVVASLQGMEVIEPIDYVTEQLPDQLGIAIIEEIAVMPAKKKTSLTVLFANNSSSLDSKSKSAIDKLAKSLKKMPSITITVVGYTNSAGGREDKKLALARAKAVAKRLIADEVTAKIIIKERGIAQSGTTFAALALARKAVITVQVNVEE